MTIVVLFDSMCLSYFFYKMLSFYDSLTFEYSFDDRLTLS